MWSTSVCAPFAAAAAGDGDGASARRAIAARRVTAASASAATNRLGPHRAEEDQGRRDCCGQHRGGCVGRVRPDERGRRQANRSKMGENMIVHEETMCCGYKKCPTVKIFDDGSVVLTDDDAETGSVGTIKLRPEVVARLKELLIASR
jgi:hypothetical protein